MITINDRDINDIRRAIESWADKNPSRVEDIAQMVGTAISSRVQDRGRGVNGVMRYKSAKYKKFRDKKGRTVAFKTLNFTGKMWQSLGTTLKGSSAIIGFGGRENILKASGNEERDPFFSITDQENKLINNELEKMLEELKL